MPPNDYAPYLRRSGPCSCALNKHLATALSAVFHPLLVPSYLYYLVCYRLPGVVLYPLLPDRWRVLALVFGCTFVLPTLVTAGLYWLGAIDSLTLRRRRQRRWPLLAATLSFGAGAGLLAALPLTVDALLQAMLWGMAGAVLLTLGVSLRWKISAHAVGMGGAVGLLALLYLSGQPDQPAPWWLAGSLVLAGAVLSARLELRAHSPAQVWAGLALGLGVVAGVGLAW